MSDAEFYEQESMWADRPLTAREQQRLEETAAALPPSESWADVGAGDGRLLKAVSSAGLAIAVERSGAALSFAAGLRVQGDVSALPLADGAVDTVSICEVLEHLPAGVFERTLLEAARVARRHVLITVPNREDLNRGMVRCPSCRCVFHRHRHLKTFLPEMMGKLVPGFALVRCEEIGPEEPAVPFWMVKAARRVGVLPGPGGTPQCPQCGFGEDEGRTEAGGSGMGRRAERLPLPRKKPWLLALYERKERSSR